jgi:hypothetical protein
MTLSSKSASHLIFNLKLARISTGEGFSIPSCAVLYWCPEGMEVIRRGPSISEMTG